MSSTAVESPPEEQAVETAATETASEQEHEKPVVEVDSELASMFHKQGEAERTGKPLRRILFDEEQEQAKEEAQEATTEAKTEEKAEEKEETKTDPVMSELMERIESLTKEVKSLRETPAEKTEEKAEKAPKAFELSEGEYDKVFDDSPDGLHAVFARYTEYLQERLAPLIEQKAVELIQGQFPDLFEKAIEGKADFIQRHGAMAGLLSAKSVTSPELRGYWPEVQKAFQDLSGKHSDKTQLEILELAEAAVREKHNLEKAKKEPKVKASARFAPTPGAGTPKPTDRTQIPRHEQDILDVLPRRKR